MLLSVLSSIICVAAAAGRYDTPQDTVEDKRDFSHVQYYRAEPGYNIRVGLFEYVIAVG
jgi:hypothetical protein